MRLTKHDYLNLTLFFLMSTLVIVSYMSSGFYSEPTIDGHVVHTLGTTIVSFNATSQDNPSTLYATDRILFYISLIKDGNALSSVSCKIKIGALPEIDMQYISLAGYYSYTNIFDTEGIYQYMINCDMSDIDEQNISITASANIQKKLPDYTISIVAAPRAQVNSETSANVTITNIGQSTATNDVVFKIVYGDGVEVPVTKSIGSTPATYNLNHIYSSNGTFKISAVVDSNNQYAEISESNNNASTSIIISDITENNDVCGNLDKSAILTSDVYCQNGVTLVAELQLDCDGHRIYGDGMNNGKSGITVNARSTIRNCIIDGFSKGVDANAAVIMNKNTIKNTDTALVLKANGNTVINNTFSDSIYGVLNHQERLLQYNNFVNLVVYNINTSVDADISKNYFGTTTHSKILSWLRNSTPYTLENYYDRSVLDPAAKLIVIDKTGPSISVKLLKEESDSQTKVTFTALTDEKASCRYADASGIDYASMADLDDGSGNNHSIVLYFYDKAAVTLYFRCVDDFGNPSKMIQSEKITTRTPTEFAIDVIQNRSDDNKEELDKYRERKLDLEESLKKATNDVTRNGIWGDINRTVVDIEYYEKLYKIDIATRDALKKIRDKVDSAFNSIIDNDEKLDLIKSNITAITIEIDGKVKNDTLSVDVSLEKKFNYLEDLHLYLDQNLTKEKDMLSFRDDYIIKVLDMERSELSAKKEKYEKLMAIDNIGYKDIIEDIDSQYDDKDVKIKEEGDQQAYEDLNNEINMLKDIISLKEDLLDEMDALEKIVSDRADYAASISNNILEQELNRIGRDIAIKQDETNKLIDELRLELDARTEERANFKRYYERIDNLEEIVFNSVQTSSPSNASEYEAILLSVYPESLIDNISVRYSRVVGNSTHFNLSSISNEMRSLDNNTFFVEWFQVDSTDQSAISEMQINFSIERSEMSFYENMVSDLSCYKTIASQPLVINSTIQTEMEWIQTSKSEEGDFLLFSCSYSSPGIFAIGYANSSARSGDNQTVRCTPDWQPNEFTECDPSRQKSRNWQDKNRCDKGNLTYKESINCTDEEINCKDGIKNDNEEGIDCGLICNKACDVTAPSPESPQPATPEVVTSIPKTRNILKDVIIVLILSTILIGGAIFKFKFKPKKIEKSSIRPISAEYQKHDIELIDALAKRVFNYQDTAQIEAEFISKKRTKEHIEFYSQIIKYILKKLELNPKTQTIIQELIAAQWTESDAKAIVEHVAARFVGYHIEEFGNMFTSEDEKRETMMEMLGSEGFEPAIIDLALRICAKPQPKLRK